MSIDVDGRILVDLAEAKRAAGTPAPTARLLAEFDAALLSHQDRSRILPDVSVIASPNGLIPSTFVIDGAVAGRWTLTVEDGDARATVTPLRRLPQRVHSAVRRELRSLSRDLHGARLAEVAVD